MGARTILAVVLAAGSAAVLAAGSLQPARPSVDEAARRQFDRKVAEYAALHRELEGSVPTVEVSEDPAKVRAAMDALAAKIQAARRDTPQGDIFTEEARKLFRRLISEGCAGDHEALLALAMEEAPPQMPEPRANARWPAGVPFSLMTPAMLCSLPELPPELEYRFIGRHLVLHDAHADLIVDVLRNAIPSDPTH